MLQKLSATEVLDVDSAAILQGFDANPSLKFNEPCLRSPVQLWRINIGGLILQIFGAVCMVIIRVSLTFFHVTYETVGLRVVFKLDRCKTAAGHDVSIFFQQPACDRATCKRLIRAMYLSTVGSMVGWARFRTWRDLHHPATNPQAKYRIPGSKPVRT